MNLKKSSRYATQGRVKVHVYATLTEFDSKVKAVMRNPVL